MKVLKTAPQASKYYTLQKDGGLIPNACAPDRNQDKKNTALPNCVSYAAGRFSQIADKGKIIVSMPNGGLFLKYNTNYKQGKTPKLGAIAVWTGGSDGCGHIAIVEQIKEDGTVVFSESTYNNVVFRIRNGKAPNYWTNTAYKFAGFIYNPYIGSKTLLNTRKELLKFKNKDLGYDFDGDGKVTSKDVLLLKKSL